MSYSIHASDDVTALKGKGLELLFAKGTTVPIAAFSNGNLICVGEQEIVGPHNYLSLNPAIVARMEAPTLVLKEAA
jgi:hypothetical protein